jgi:hypothetical protein
MEEEGLSQEGRPGVEQLARSSVAASGSSSTGLSCYVLPAWLPFHLHRSPRQKMVTEKQPALSR